MKNSKRKSKSLKNFLDNSISTEKSKKVNGGDDMLQYPNGSRNRNREQD